MRAQIGTASTDNGGLDARTRGGQHHVVDEHTPASHLKSG
jgi:hypothetical protein